MYDSQHLYTIYIHTKPDFEGYLEGSLFYKREVPAPIQVSCWLPGGRGSFPEAACMADKSCLVVLPGNKSAC